MAEELNLPYDMVPFWIQWTNEKKYSLKTFLDCLIEILLSKNTHIYI